MSSGGFLQRIGRSEAANGLTMISPTAIYAILLLAAPLVTVFVYSFMADGPAPVRSEVLQSQCRLVALNPALDLNCALVVDRLIGLRNIDSFVESSTAPDDAPNYFGHRYTDVQGLVWQELNLQALSQQPRFLSVSA